MADHLSKEKRSWNMSRIRSKNTTPEIAIRKELHKSGIRYRIHTRELPGNPDLSNKKKKFAVFVNGCFWHQHSGCSRATVPKTNKKYWLPKLQKNIDRQKENIDVLMNNSWNVFVIWECEAKNGKNIRRMIKNIKSL
jgi:DNA mismatch endonuclease (patch repair protein)